MPNFVLDYFAGHPPAIGPLSWKFLLWQYSWGATLSPNALRVKAVVDTTGQFQANWLVLDLGTFTNRIVDIIEATYQASIPLTGRQQLLNRIYAEESSTEFSYQEAMQTLARAIKNIWVTKRTRFPVNEMSSILNQYLQRNQGPFYADIEPFIRGWGWDTNDPLTYGTYGKGLHPLIVSWNWYRVMVMQQLFQVWGEWEFPSPRLFKHLGISYEVHPIEILI